MLIDDFMPRFDFSETHDIQIGATAENVLHALNEVDLCESTIIRWLVRLRGIWTPKMTLHELRESHFVVLGESKEEFLLGLVGRFWTLTGNLQKISSDNFRKFNEKGFAKAVWNFGLSEARGEVNLTTETRIMCTDAESRKSFGLYWTFIQPFSGLIRKELLRLVKEKAEKHALRSI